MPIIYKTFSQSDLDNKSIYETSAAENQKISDILTSFVTLFKNKHLS